MKTPIADLRVHSQGESNEELLQKGKEKGLGLMILTPSGHTSEDFVRSAKRKGIMSVAAIESSVLFHGKEVRVAGYMENVTQDIGKMIGISHENKKQWLLDQLSMLENIGFPRMEDDIMEYLSERSIDPEDLNHGHIVDCIFESSSYFSIAQGLFLETPTKELFIEKFLQDRRKVQRVPLLSVSKDATTFRDFSKNSWSDIISLLDAETVFHDTHEFHIRIGSYIEEGFNAIDINPMMTRAWVYAILDAVGEDNIMLTYGSGSSGAEKGGGPGEINRYLNEKVCHEAVRAFIKRFHLACPH